MKSNITDEQFTWLRLLEILKPYNISKFAFDGLIEFITPPPKYSSLATIIENMSHVLQSCLDILAASHIEDKTFAHNIRIWLDCCSTIKAHLDEIESRLPGFSAKGKFSHRPPYRDFFESHPLAVALWCSVQDGDLHRRYVNMQAHLCLAFHILKTQNAKKQKRLASAQERACLAARKLSWPDYAELLKTFPDQPLSIKAYRRAIEPFDGDKDIHPLLLLIDYALDEKSTRERTGVVSKRGSTGAFSKEQQIVSFCGDEEADSGEKLTLLKVHTGKRNEVADRKKSLCNPDEFLSRLFVVQEHDGKDPSGGLSGCQQHMIARGASSAIAMHNQRFPCDWERLTAYELETFLMSLGELSAGSNSIMGIPPQELAAFLSISFWMSVPPDVARCTTLVIEPARCKGALGIKWLSNGEGWWVVKPRVAKLESVPAKVLVSQAVPIATGYYTLSIPKQAAASLNRHLASFSSSFDPVKIFNRETAEYELAGNEFMKTLRKREGGRQSLQRIAMHMYHQIAKLTGADVTAAMSITGRNDPLGAVPLHYTANSIERLKSIYAEACSSILTDAGMAIEPVSPQKESRYFVGSRYVPKQETVLNLVSNLRERIKSTREGTKSDPIRLHNLITVYTVTMLGFATGYRAVHDPLLQEAEIDLESGFAVISDKDDDSFYNSRIVWLPDICLQQLELYKKHISELQQWLFRHNLQLFFKSREKSTTGRQADRENPSLFFLEQNAEDLPVQPKYLKKLLAKTEYQLPINSNRHYLRTELMNKGCPLEVVSAFLGHWERGEEPWGRYSGFSPLVYREELSKYLNPLLKDSGWIPEAGLIRR